MGKLVIVHRSLLFFQFSNLQFQSVSNRHAVKPKASRYYYLTKRSIN